jgi:hypothetical protein
MHIFIAIWPDDTATLQILAERNGRVLYDNLDEIGNDEEAQIFEVVKTTWSPCEFKLKRVRITDAMRIVAANQARKKI